MDLLRYMVLTITAHIHLLPRWQVFDLFWLWLHDKIGKLKVSTLTAHTSMVDCKIMKRFIWSHHRAMKTSPPTVLSDSKSLFMASDKQAGDGMIHCHAL